MIKPKSAHPCDVAAWAFLYKEFWPVIGCRFFEVNCNGTGRPYSFNMGGFSRVTESGALNHGYPAKFEPNGANKSARFR
jgi:hypothetical protein